MNRKIKLYNDMPYRIGYVLPDFPTRMVESGRAVTIQEKELEAILSQYGATQLLVEKAFIMEGDDEVIAEYGIIPNEHDHTMDYLKTLFAESDLIALDEVLESCGQYTRDKIVHLAVYNTYDTRIINLVKTRTKQDIHSMRSAVSEMEK